MARTLALALVVTVAGCGARTAPRVEGDAGPPPRDMDAGDRPDGGGVDAGPPWACRYEPIGEPMVLFTESRFDEGLSAPELLVLEEGPEARLALSATHEHFWHPEIHIAEVFVGDAWPDGVRPGNGFVHVGIDAHGAGQLSPSPDGQGLALTWYQGDLARGAPAGVGFRTLDPDTWRPGRATLVEEDSAYAYAMVPWAGGYALAYRSALSEGAATESAIGLLDASGGLVGAPLVMNPRATGPIGVSVAASDASLLTAANDETGTDFGRVSPEPALEPTDRVNAHEGRRPRSPTIQAQGSLAYAVWREESLDEDDRSFAVRLAQLDARGELEGLVLDEIANPIQGPALVVAPTGAVVMWVEARDLELMPGTVGRAAIVMRRVTPEGELTGRFEIPTTSLTYAEPYSAVTLRGGRMLLVTWSGTEEGGADRIIYLARFDCVPI